MTDVSVYLHGEKVKLLHITSYPCPHLDIKICYSICSEYWGTLVRANSADPDQTAPEGAV